ncbi:MAG TPA: ricin-type beta-trefoil lectin domain protein [Polyangia bacterium]|nr:ricin-type beta-trefoil lectin domain protein [Polyangia bacterium]
MRDTAKKVRIGIAIGALVGAAGCAGQAEDVGSSTDFGVTSFNGITTLNGVTTFNGISSSNGVNTGNGVNIANGMSTSNGINTLNGYMTTDGGRKVVSYMVRCALASNDSLTKQDQYGNSYTFTGSLGLCPAWKNNSIANDGPCQEWLSACLMAHINTAGIHIPIWLDADFARSADGTSGIGWGIDTTNFPRQEGSFFGNLMATGSLANVGMPTVTAPVAYYCDGDGFAQGPNGDVAGRLGAGQNSAPYVNPYASSASTLCKDASGVVAQYSNGTGQGDPDGYKKLDANGTPWNHIVTVWRNTYFTPVFDAAYHYTVSALVTRDNPMVMDVDSNGVVQQWNKSANLDSSEFDFLVVSGVNHRIVKRTDHSKCVDGGAGANNGAVVVATCNGSAGQTWSVNPMPAKYGTFWIKHSGTNRCLSVPGNSTVQRAAGTDLQTQDCVSTNSGQQMRIAAEPLP